mmetsp:Transcript_39324/g.93181  ORF Transcript_39324/g.93181 Transcript_39324/m.93181 type:complete len:183 (+) Transcript_39324:40-588(+)
MIMSQCTRFTVNIHSLQIQRAACRVQTKTRGRRLLGVRAAHSFEVSLVRGSEGGPETKRLKDDVTLVGKTSASILSLQVDGVADEHARLEKKNGRLFCTALVGSGNLTEDTRTWLNGNQIRSGVEYIVPAGGRLAFGTQEEVWVAEFEERRTDDAMAKMMMQAMAQSDEVRRKLEGEGGDGK